MSVKYKCVKCKKTFWWQNDREATPFINDVDVMYDDCFAKEEGGKK